MAHMIAKGTTELLPKRLEHVDDILDRVHPPVARLRIVSNGLAQNHTLYAADDLSGTRACLSCGNCVDACPVVADKPAGTMFVRTSMLLEHVVAEECRRCHQCVAACPQVNKDLKDYVRGFRRIERVAHWQLLISYLVLMTTGILINHWGEGLPWDLRLIFSTTHKMFTVVLVLAPALLFFYDRRHFLLTLRQAFTWSNEDRVWFRDAWAWVKSRGKAGALKRGAYNPGQRFWYLYIPVALLIFAITGSIKWVGEEVLGKGAVDTATLVHVVMAYTTDFLVLAHVCLKLGWPVARDAVRFTRYYFAIQDRRRASEPLRAR
jgi:cytochrome b subunit of formate dehydrogenase